MNFLLFVETSGNQSYIYASNRLRENIGASELTYCAGTRWILDAAGFRDAPCEDPAAFSLWLRRHAQTARTGDVEIILSTSGKSMLRLSCRANAERIVREVTARAIRSAPGLTVTGAIVELADFGDDSVRKAIHDAHTRFNENRDLMPSPAQRFGLLPFCEPCSTSGLPASTVDKDKTPVSDAILAKREAAGQWYERIQRVIRSHNKAHKDLTDILITSNVSQLEDAFEDANWLGVVFSDGNGLGQIMMRFDHWLGVLRQQNKETRDYLSVLRSFSIELDEATQSAFCRACVALSNLGVASKTKRGADRLPVVPLLLGGDDLTVLVQGNAALPFTEEFLKAFEEETSKKETIASIASVALGAARLSAGAGVAIVKKHFPFHSAHGLAESLLKSAKLTKKKVVQCNSSEPYPCSSLDFHILFDSTYSDLDSLRKRRRTAVDGERLWAGPYVVTAISDLPAASTDSQQWVQRHHLSKLRSAVAALTDRDDDNRLRLPSTQMHMLRESLSQGKVISDSRLSEVKAMATGAMNDLVENESLFFDDSDSDPQAGSEPVWVSRFLDALSSSDFWPSATLQNNQENTR